MKYLVIAALAALASRAAIADGQQVCGFVDTARAYHLKIAVVGVPGSEFTYTRNDHTLAKFWYKPITMKRGEATIEVPGAFTILTDYDGPFPVPYLALHAQNNGRCEYIGYNGLGYKFPTPPGAPVVPVPEVETHVQTPLENGFMSVGQYIQAWATFAE